MLTYSHQLKCTKPSWLLYKVKPSWRAIIFVWCTQVSWEGKKHVAMIRMLSGESWARNRNSKFAEQGEWEAGEKTCRVALVCVPQTPGRMFSKMTKRSKNHRSSSMSKSTKSSLTPYRHWLSCPYCEKKKPFPSETGSKKEGKSPSTILKTKHKKVSYLGWHSSLSQHVIRVTSGHGQGYKIDMYRTGTS